MTDDDIEQDVIEQIRSTGPVISGAAVALAVLSLGLGIFFVPRIEGWLFPIFDKNDIPVTSVMRTGQKLCWTRVGLKRRAPTLTDVDVDVDYISASTGKLAHQPTPALYDDETGEELTSDNAPPAGKPFSKRVCLDLARRIKPGQPVQVRQTAYFQSFTDLYDVPVRFPTIVDPPEASDVFALHDKAPGPEGGRTGVAP